LELLAINLEIGGTSVNYIFMVFLCQMCCALSFEVHDYLIRFWIHCWNVPGSIVGMCQQE